MMNTNGNVLRETTRSRWVYRKLHMSVPSVVQSIFIDLCINIQNKENKEKTKIHDIIYHTHVCDIYLLILP